jgi:hypothetical protein
MVDIANIPINKIRFRAERNYAKILKGQNIPYVYQPSIRLSVGIFHADFYLPNEDIYIEIVGSRQAYNQAKRKIRIFRKTFGYDKLRVLDEEGHIWPADLDNKYLENGYVTVGKAVQYLGIARQAIWKLYSRGIIEGIKPNAKIFYKKDSIRLYRISKQEAQDER